MKTVSHHGVYKVDIPLHDGKSAVIRGVGLNQVTSKFPMYPLHDQVQKDIIKNYKLASKNPKSLPRLCDFVVGETDLMVGVKYLKYFSECVFRLPTGLTIYRLQFGSPDCSRGVVSTPCRLVFDASQQQLTTSGYILNSRLITTK